MTLKQTLRCKLQSGFEEMKLQVSESKLEKLVEYLLLLTEWNAVHNLSGIKDPLQMCTRHILDSLTLYPFLESSLKLLMQSQSSDQATSRQKTLRILDVGTGAGLPGIPLAILFQESQSEVFPYFVLLDSNQKKITFVQHALITLKLQNIEAKCQRVEQYQVGNQDDLFDWVISRAFSSLTTFVNTANHLLKPEGIWVAMKGKNESLLFEEQPLGYTVEVQPVFVPELHEERNLVFVRQERL